MKRCLVLLLLLVTACQPSNTAWLCECRDANPVVEVAVTLPAASGVGVCHWIAPDGLPAEVGWGYETTTAVHWKTLEPQRDVFDFGLLDGYVQARPGVKLWLAIQTVGAGIDGQPKAPQWLIDEGAVWHTAGCSNHYGVFAVWDAVYLRRLEVLLAAVNEHISSQDAAYQEAIGGIVMMTGGAYGEAHLYQWHETCNLEKAIRDYYGLGHTDEQFDDAWSESVLRILDRYMEAFPDWPIMVQLGWPVVDEPLLWYGWNRYGGRLYAKWQGWAPTNVGDGKDGVRQDGNEYYGNLFRGYYGMLHYGFEPGHPVQEWLGPAQYLNAMQWALDAKASFACFQAGETLEAAQALDEWAAFDAELEANAAGVVPTATPMPMETPGPTPTITASPTRPTITTTPVSPAPTATAIPTLTPKPDTWLCDCVPVTPTPGG